MPQANERPLSIAMLALGGQGGGVLTNWLVELAEANGFLAQSTYIAGVAQRTGATVYCVEMIPVDSASAAGRDPVFSPTPIPGDVDLVIAGEMAETGRAILRGFVTPQCSTVIASSHRVYSITEKSALGDGIIDQTGVAKIAEEVSKRLIMFDMELAANDANCAISAVLFGAVAGSGALPFDRKAFEATIRRSGRSVDANLRGFAAGFTGATRNGPGDAMPKTGDRPFTEIQPLGPRGKQLADRVNAELPDPVKGVALHGVMRALEYQDHRYATDYLDRLLGICRVDDEIGGRDRGFALSAEVARQLALQMCYEDTIRVADMKTRAARFLRIREHVAAADDQPVHVIEYFHPRIEELCDTLPRALGAFVLESPIARKMLAPFFRSGRNVTTTNFGGYLLLHVISGFRRFRRSSYRYEKQQTLIDDWLQHIHLAVVGDYDYALALANSIEIVKGYGDTYERGLRRYQQTVAASDSCDPADAAAIVRRLHKAALADEKGAVFSATLAELEIQV